MVVEVVGAQGRQAVLRGLGGAVPPWAVDNAEVAARFGREPSWIASRTGIERRHRCPQGWATSDLATSAGERALTSAGRAHVDGLVLATSTPDRQIPGTAPLVASRLGLGGAAFDVNAVCAGFVYALSVGASMVVSGVLDSVLVIGADTFSSVVDPMDEQVAPLFGDGAGAVVLEAAEPGEPGSLGPFDLGSDGTGEDLIVVPGGGSRQRSGGVAADPASAWLTMRGREVFTQAVTRMSESCRAVLARCDLQTSDVDRVVGHQANLRILRMLADRLDLPHERLVWNIDRVGNTSAASVPLALASGALAGQLQAGDRVLLTAFGSGLAWGSTLLDWPKIVVDPWEES